MEGARREGRKERPQSDHHRNRSAQVISETVFTQILNLPAVDTKEEGPTMEPSAFSKLADNQVAAPAVT